MTDIVELKKDNVKVYPKTHFSGIEGYKGVEYVLLYSGSITGDPVNTYLSLNQRLSPFSFLEFHCHSNKIGLPFFFNTNRTWGVGHQFRRGSATPLTLNMATIEVSVDNTQSLPRIQIRQNNCMTTVNFGTPTFAENDISVTAIYGVKLVM